MLSIQTNRGATYQRTARAPAFGPKPAILQRGHAETVEKSLGHRLIIAESEMDGSELEHGQEVSGVFFVAGGDPSEVLDTIELRAR